MRARKVFGIILCVVAVMFIPLGIYLSWRYPSGYEYTGKILMTEQQYNQFKSDCASPNITRMSVSVLDSDYPTLVNFDISDKTETFPFGTSNGGNLGGAFLLVFVSIPFAVAGIWVM